MIYGAYGYTGTLLAEEAVRRGHRPVLSGRDAERLAPLAHRLGLESLAVRLEDKPALAAAVERMEVVLNAAGPFTRTSEPMVNACLKGRTNYVDITGELPVLQRTLQRDAEARERGVLLLSGGGFDVVPSDCLAAYVAARVPEAVELEIGVDALTSPSKGTLLSTLELAPEGGKVRRNGRLVEYPLGKGARRQRFAEGYRHVLPLPIGDLETAYHTTGIGDITAYMAVPAAVSGLMTMGGSMLAGMLRSSMVRGAAGWLIKTMAKGPDAAARETGRSDIWAAARDAHGKGSEAWLATLEAYRFTAVAGIRIVEHVLAAEPKLAGALTPAQALGADFPLEIEGTRRYDSLPAQR